MSHARGHVAGDGGKPSTPCVDWEWYALDLLRRFTTYRWSSRRSQDCLSFTRDCGAVLEDGQSTFFGDIQDFIGA